MDYNFNLDFNNRTYQVFPPIQLLKNTKYIDKFYFNVISDIKPKQIELIFKGFDKTLKQKIILRKDKKENIYKAFINVDERFTKFVFTTDIYFNIYDYNEEITGTSSKINIIVENSIIKDDDCSKEEGLIDHRDLINRDAPMQHYASSIVGYQEETVEEDLEYLYSNLQDLEDNINLEIERVERESKERDKEIQENLDAFNIEINQALDKEIKDRIDADDDLRSKININQINVIEQFEALKEKDKQLEEAIIKETIERKDEDKNINEIIDNLNINITSSINNNFNIVTENITNLGMDLEKEITERKIGDNLLELNKINKTEIGSSVVPLDKNNIIPKKFIPLTVLRAFSYYETISDRDLIESVEDDWCYVNEDKRFYVFKNNIWKPITLLEIIINAINIQFDNSNTSLSSTNVQEAIVEIKEFLIKLEDDNEIKYNFLTSEINRLSALIDEKISDLQNLINNDLSNITNQLENLNTNIKQDFYIKPEVDNKLEILQNNTNNDLTNAITQIENIKTDIKDDLYTKLEVDNKLEILQNNTNNDLTSITNQLENLNTIKNEFYTKPETDDKLNNLQNLINNDLSNIVNESQEFAKAVQIRNTKIFAIEHIIDLTSYLELLITEIIGGGTLPTITIEQITTLINDLIDNHNINISAHPYILDELNIIKLSVQKFQNDFDNHIIDSNAHQNIIRGILDSLKQIIDNFKNYSDITDKEIDDLKKRILKLETDIISVINADVDGKINNHNTSPTSHQDIRNQLADLNQKVIDLNPKIIITNEKTISDFINNNSILAIQIQNGNLVYLTNIDNQIEIYKFFTNASVIEGKALEGWDNPENYILLKSQINIDKASSNNLGVVGIGNNINIDQNGYIYLEDASTTKKGLIILGNLQDLENGINKVVTAETIKTYFNDKLNIQTINNTTIDGSSNNYNASTKTLTINTNPIYTPKSTLIATDTNSPVTGKAVADYIENLLIISPNEEIEEKTYDELEAIANSNSLIAGKSYIISDFVTKYRQPETNVIKTGTPEKLLVKALNTNQFIPTAYSLSYPQDILEYDFTNNKCEDNITPRKGKIIKRIDTKRNLEANYDWRNVVFARFRATGPIYIDGQNSIKNNFYVYNNNVYKCINRTSTFSTDDFFEICTTDDCLFADNFSAANLNLDKVDYIERYTFDSNQNYKINSKNAINEPNSNHRNNTIIGFNNTFLQNCLNNILKANANTFSANCSGNNLSNGSSNIILLDGCIGNYFVNSNRIILLKRCGKNSFGDGCFNNLIQSESNNNFLEQSCRNNNFSFYCDKNYLQSECENNNFYSYSLNNFLYSSIQSINLPSSTNNNIFKLTNEISKKIIKITYTATEQIITLVP